MKKERLILLASIILVAAFARLLPHPANVTPVAAIALLAGATLPRGLAFIVPLAAMLVSDIIIGFHNTMLFVYISMIITVGLGTLLKGHIGAMKLAGASLISSLIFFIITNVGVWLVGELYPLTVDGFAQCFAAAIPFFTNSILGDLFFAGLLFGVFALAEKYIPAVRSSAA